MLKLVVGWCLKMTTKEFGEVCVQRLRAKIQVYNSDELEV